MIFPFDFRKPLFGALMAFLPVAAAAHAHAGARGVDRPHREDHRRSGEIHGHRRGEQQQAHTQKKGWRNGHPKHLPKSQNSTWDRGQEEEEGG